MLIINHEYYLEPTLDHNRFFEGKMLKNHVISVIFVCVFLIGIIKSNSLQNDDHSYAVILAGGKGERLWPLSRENKPKQFLEFFGNVTLLELTYNRVTPILPAEHIWVITNQLYKQQVGTILGHTLGGIIAEPFARNTAPAILLACLTLSQHDPDATVIFLPADHYIKEEELFTKELHTLLSNVHINDGIGLIGLYPTYPATGLGYIEYQKQSSLVLQKVIRFHEKPSASQAQKYLETDNMLWNGGYFCGKASTFIALFQKHAPLIYEQVQGYLNNTVSYDQLTNISFDHAVLEHAQNIYVLPVEVTWSDVGNLETFLSSQGQRQENINNLVAINANNNLIHNKNKFTALIGVNDLCIINTNDVLLVAHQKEVERVKEILLKLQPLEKNSLRSIV